MRGFILAAGFGTRMQPLTDYIPKALVPLAGYPLLHHSLSFINKCGVHAIGVNAHYFFDRIMEYRKTSFFPFEIFHETPAIRGTGGALHLDGEFLMEDDTFIISNVDIVARFDIGKHISSFEKSNDCCRLLAWKNNSGTGTIVYNPENLHYLGTAKDVTDNHGSFATADFIGITLYRREFLNIIKPDDFSIVPVWRRAIGCGMAVSVGIIDSGYWRDIGSIKALAHAHFDIIDGKLDIALPRNLLLDPGARSCYPLEWGRERISLLGDYCWIGDKRFEPAERIERTVTFPGVTGGPDRPLRNIILTPWGEMGFDE